MQPHGTGTCGQFVLHFEMDKIRRYFGEGASAGYPDHKDWTNKMASVMEKIVENKNKSSWEPAAKKVIAKFLEAEKERAQIAKEMAESRDFMEDIAKMASIQLAQGFGHFGGCTKCGYRKLGSTCCNPNKINAKDRAEKEFAEKSGSVQIEGQYDPERYKFHFLQICLEIVKECTGDPLLPDKTKKGSGDCPLVKANQFRMVLPVC